jgi:hypothetical protein
MIATLKRPRPEAAETVSSVEARAPEAEAPPTGTGTRSADWEVVPHAPKRHVEAQGAQQAAPATGFRAPWELPESTTAALNSDPGLRTGLAPLNEDEYYDEEEVGEPGPLQTVLSYAGLAAAVVVVLLGIALMISTRG